MAGAPSCDVQCGQRVAFSGIVDPQYWHSLADGGGGPASSFRRKALMPLISRKTAKATIRKLMTAFTKMP